jgi:hypothetical protein
MSEKIISLNDNHSIADLIKSDHKIRERLGGKAKRTKITILDHNTGEVLGEYENKVVISGSMLSGCKVFGIDTSLILPSYNDEMEFDNDQPKDPENMKKSIVQLFCVGDDGCGPTQKDVFIVNFTDRIKPLTDINDVNAITHGIPLTGIYLDTYNAMMAQAQEIIRRVIGEN